MIQIEQILGQTRIQRLVDEIRDRRAPSDVLFWVPKIRDVDCEDEEITAVVSGTVTIADIVENDAAAVTRSADPVRLVQTKIPNIKHGKDFGQRQIDLIRRIVAGLGFNSDFSSLESYMAGSMDRLLQGVDHRKEALFWAMMRDDLDYNKGGIVFSNLSWGMKSDLKVTPATAWTTANKATSTPIADILNTVQLARDKYGVTYDRIIMSTTALLRISETTEFLTRSKLYLPNGLDGSAYIGNNAAQSDIVGRLLNMTVEIFDGQFQDEAADGSLTLSRYCPETDVVLYASAAVSSGLLDFGNGIVTESTVGALSGHAGFTGPLRGPVGYVSGSSDLNPPALTQWAVARGFPRKHHEAASAVIYAWS